MTKPAIDLTRHSFMRPVGDLVVFGTWIWSEEQEDSEPALVIVPRYRRDGFKPVCVALSAAWKYNPEHGEPGYAARAAGWFVKQLGMEECMSSAHSVIDIIHDHLGDLISMPPNPESAIVGAEAKIDLGNGVSRTIQLMDYESVKQY